MKKTPLIAFCLLALASCQTRILYHQLHTPQASLGRIDSVTTLHFADERRTPDPIFFMGTLKCRFSVKDIRVGYDSLVRFAAEMTRQKGANVIKVRDARIAFMAFELKVDAYSLPDLALKTYQSELDSADRVRLAYLASHSIVHILDRDDMGRRSVFIDDSLVAITRGVGFDGVRKPGRVTLVLNKAGVVKIISQNSYDPDLTEIHAQPGKEYYIVLHTNLNRRQFEYHHTLTDHDRFDNRDIFIF